MLKLHALIASALARSCNWRKKAPERDFPCTLLYQLIVQDAFRSRCAPVAGGRLRKKIRMARLPSCHGYMVVAAKCLLGGRVKTCNVNKCKTTISGPSGQGRLNNLIWPRQAVIGFLYRENQAPQTIKVQGNLTNPILAARASIRLNHRKHRPVISAKSVDSPPTPANITARAGK